MMILKKKLFLPRAIKSVLPLIGLCLFVFSEYRSFKTTIPKKVKKLKMFYYGGPLCRSQGMKGQAEGSLRLIPQLFLSPKINLPLSIFASIG